MSAPSPSSGRGGFQSRIGFILAAAGSAIGLGNIWRFPYTAGENGGGAFIALYLLCVLGLGVPVMLAELAMGRATRKNPVGAYARLGGKPWAAAGGLGVVTGFGILAFYSVVAGWTLGYLWHAVSGTFAEPIDAEASAALFTGLISDPVWAIALAGIFLGLTMVVVRSGVSGGIEIASKILMPVFFVLLVALAIRSVTLPGGAKGLAFIFEADFSKIHPSVVAAAMGQAMFSLSLGMGAMITYGSYFPRDENLVVAGVSVAFFDTLIALLGGFLVFPALFAAGIEPTAGPGLVFVVMPTIFDKLPMGQLFAAAFYALLAIAALTSTISLLEVVVSYFVDERGWDRHFAVYVVGGACFLLAIPSALSQGGAPALSDFLGTGKGWLDWQSILFGTYSLVTGALLTCVLVGWRWGTDAAKETIEEGGHRLPVAPLWAVLVRYVCPLAVVTILIYVVTTGASF